MLSSTCFLGIISSFGAKEKLSTVVKQRSYLLNWWHMTFLGRPDIPSGRGKRINTNSMPNWEHGMHQLGQKNAHLSGHEQIYQERNRAAGAAIIGRRVTRVDRKERRDGIHRHKNWGGLTSKTQKFINPPPSGLHEQLCIACVSSCLK